MPKTCQTPGVSFPFLLGSSIPSKIRVVSSLAQTCGAEYVAPNPRRVPRMPAVDFMAIASGRLINKTHDGSAQGQVQPKSQVSRQNAQHEPAEKRLQQDGC